MGPLSELTVSYFVHSLELHTTLTREHGLGRSVAAHEPDTLREMDSVRRALAKTNPRAYRVSTDVRWSKDMVVGYP